MYLFEIDILEDLLMDSKKVVGFTGAGISTDSGIQDFRTPGSGLWEKYDPGLMDLSTFLREPERFFNMAREIAEPILSARPNESHEALTRLQVLGKMDYIITQNIDGLHQKAGSNNVIELHGNLRECKCTRCNKKYPIDVLIEKFFLRGEKVPKCDACGTGFLKPNVVFFGENLPRDALEKAYEVSRGCDLFIVIGSSLLVYPAASLPKVALESGADLVIINLQPTPLDNEAILALHVPVKNVLPRVAEDLEYKINFMKS
ncbi:MAG: SIR2 family NAD-dependent protein deacylase [Promethearchaeota archaeon]